MRFKSRFLNPLFPNNTLGVNITNQIIPIADHSRSLDFPTELMREQWAILDTVDMYTPTYDKPMTYSAIINTMKRIGATNIHGNRSTFCFKATAP
jgi:hypothetical protein